MLRNEAANFSTKFNEFLKYFESQCIVKEGPAAFCVYQEIDRTNNSLESLNCNVNTKIQRSLSLFKFVEQLRSVELTASREYAIAAGGGTQIRSKKKKKYIQRDKIIESIQLKFAKSQLSVAKFFDKVNLLDDDNMNIDIDNESDSDNDENDDNETDRDLLCVICKTNPKSTLLEPCNHLKFCQVCVEELMTNDSVAFTPQCPQCHSHITGHRIVFS